MKEAQPKIWAGIDAGKEVHWAHLSDASGEKLLSRKVINDEADLAKLIDEALSLAEEVVGLWISLEAPQHCFWGCCGNVSRRSSTCRAWL